MAGLALAFLKLNWWLLGMVFDKRQPSTVRQKSSAAVFAIWALTFIVIALASQ
jgi:hypothetical protein